MDKIRWKGNQLPFNMPHKYWLTIFNPHHTDCHNIWQHHLPIMQEAMHTFEFENQYLCGRLNDKRVNGKSNILALAFKEKTTKQNRTAFICVNPPPPLRHDTQEQVFSAHSPPCQFWVIPRFKTRLLLVASKNCTTDGERESETDYTFFFFKN